MAAPVQDKEFETGFLAWAASGSAFPEALQLLLTSASAHAVGAPAPSAAVKATDDAQEGTGNSDAASGGVEPPAAPVVAMTDGESVQVVAVAKCDAARVSAAYFSMIWAAVMSRVKPSQVVDTLAAQPPTSHPAHQPALCTALVDALWLAGVQVESGFGLSAPASTGPASDAAAPLALAPSPSPTAYLSSPEWGRLCALAREALVRRMCVGGAQRP